MAITAEKLKDLSDEELLNIQIRQLDLTLNETKLDKLIQELYKELDEREIPFKPPCYITDEWLSPDGIPAIGIPFYLVHPRLVQLERKMMLEVEGGTDIWCMKLLRHETGHALNHAYKFYRKTRWKQLFGSVNSQRYSTSNYIIQPYSKKYVLHLEDHYAQAHPEEDFAETFAVWLNPKSNWSQKYQGWPALKKLNYVNHLMENIKGREPLITSNERPYAASRMRSTLNSYYNRKRKWLKKDFPGFYDGALLQLFSTKNNTTKSNKATRFLQSHKRQIIKSVSHWTGHSKYDIDSFIKKLIRRCKDMQLYAKNDDTTNITAFVTAVISKNVQLFDHEAKV